MKYKILSTIDGVVIGKIDSAGIVNSSFVDPSLGNSDWHEYQQWLAAGNTPELADPPPPPVDPGPSLADRVEAAETLINLILSEGE